MGSLLRPELVEGLRTGKATLFYRESLIVNRKAKNDKRKSPSFPTGG